MSLIGVSTTIIQITMYVAVNYIVPEKLYGTAYGILQSIGNIGNSVGPIIIGSILDSSNPEEIFLRQYNLVHIILMGFSIIGIVVSLLLLCYDVSHKGILNSVVQEN